MNAPMPQDNAARRTEAARRARRLGWKLALTAVAMIGFGYLLVPLYRVACQYTGFNGTSDRIDAASARTRTVDRNRLITVEFVAATSSGMPWEFRPDQARMTVHPGQIALATFHARNLGNAGIVGQAVPSITPNTAALHFHKIACFCFSHQPLAPGESKTMPVQFVVDADLPPEISTVTLAYTFFNLPASKTAAAASASSAAGT